MSGTSPNPGEGKPRKLRLKMRTVKQVLTRLMMIVTLVKVFGDPEELRKLTRKRMIKMRTQRQVIPIGIGKKSSVRIQKELCGKRNLLN